MLPEKNIISFYCLEYYYRIFLKEALIKDEKVIHNNRLRCRSARDILTKFLER